MKKRESKESGKTAEAVSDSTVCMKKGAFEELLEKAQKFEAVQRCPICTEKMRINCSQASPKRAASRVSAKSVDDYASDINQDSKSTKSKASFCSSLKPEPSRQPGVKLSKPEVTPRDNSSVSRQSGASCSSQVKAQEKNEVADPEPPCRDYGQETTTKVFCCKCGTEVKIDRKDEEQRVEKADCCTLKDEKKPEYCPVDCPKLQKQLEERKERKEERTLKIDEPAVDESENTQKKVESCKISKPEEAKEAVGGKQQCSICGLEGNDCKCEPEANLMKEAEPGASCSRSSRQESLSQGQADTSSVKSKEQQGKKKQKKQPACAKSSPKCARQPAKQRTCQCATGGNSRKFCCKCGLKNAGEGSKSPSCKPANCQQ